MQDLVKFVEESQLRSDLPELEIGDLLRVHLKIKEGNRERIQVFEGYLIARQGGGVRETITVRRVSYGIGAVSYTHLDVYKRQPFMGLRWRSRAFPKLYL